MTKTPRPSSFMLTFTKLTGAIPALLFFKPKIYRDKSERLPKKRPAIIICNHTSLMDFPLLLTLFPLRVMRFYMAEVLFSKTKRLRWFLYKIGGIRIDRDNAADSGFLAEVAEAVKNGDLIGIFPEGRLNTTPEKGFLEFKAGAAYTSLKFGVPVLPIYKDGNYGLLRRVSINIGKPIDLAALFPGEITPALLKDASEHLRSEVESLKAGLDGYKAAKADKKLKSIGFRLSSWFVRLTTTPIIVSAFRPKYYYTDKSVQTRRLPKPTIIVANHTSIYDPPLMVTMFMKDRAHLIAGEILYEKASLRWLLPRLGCIKLDRNAVDMDSYRKMTGVLKEGGSVALFPEGGLNTTDELLPFKAGMVLAAIQTGASILPVYIAEKYSIFGKRQRVVIDVPFEFDRSARLTGEYLDSVAGDIRRRIMYLRENYNKQRSGEK